MQTNEPIALLVTELIKPNDMHDFQSDDLYATKWQKQHG